MNLWLGLLIGLKEIWSHKFRSFLTMLGIILGVASLLSMFSLTAGMAKGMREYMQQVGGIERVEVDNEDLPEHQQALADLSTGRTVADAEAIKRSVPGVSAVTPVSTLGNAAISRGGNTFRYSVYGCWPDYVEINKHVVQHGRNLCFLDLEDTKRVCVIGRLVVDRLWPEKPDYNPIGESISINGRPFTVVGIFEYYEREEDKRRRELGIKPEFGTRRGGRARNPFDRKNSTVIVPISTMFFEFKSANVVGKEDLGPNYKLDQLTIQVSDVQKFRQTLDQVGRVLRQTHRGLEDFELDTREEWFDSIEQNVRNTRMSGGLIAGISLLVGGIGITNIMLASITERIREIGVRRAVGAKGRDIFMQIVVESAVIGFIGGLLGLLASTGMMQLLIMISPAENAPVVELQSVIVSFAFALIIGVFSGLYPAWKASRIEPIEALRYG